MIERTLCIIKPDAIKAGVQRDILTILDFFGFKVIDSKLRQFSDAQAEIFYAEHAGKEFFDRLVEFMTSGTSSIIILEKENAIADLRKLMGPSNSAEAPVGTIRHKFGNKNVITFNAIHGSDSKESAEQEIAFWFAGSELV